MRRSLLLLCYSFLFHALPAQDTLHLDLRRLLDAENYAAMVQRTSAVESLSDSSLYLRCVALSASDEVGPAAVINCFETLRDKYPYRTEGYYHGFSNALLGAERNAEGLALARTGASTYPDDADLAGILGYAYALNDKLDSSALAFNRSLQLPATPGYVLPILAQVYYNQGNPKAIEAYLTAADSALFADQAYFGYLGEAADAALRFEEYEQAIDILNRIERENKSTDWEIVALRARAYVQTGDSTAAKKERDRLIIAYEKKQLPERIAEDFLTDRYALGDSLEVRVYVRFSREGFLFYGYVFYVFDPLGTLLFTVQTEHSGALEITEDNPNYWVLGIDEYSAEGQKQRHATFWGNQYPEDPSYSRLKADVLSVIQGQAEASSATNFPDKSSDDDEAEEGGKRKKKKRKKRTKKT